MIKISIITPIHNGEFFLETYINTLIESIKYTKEELEIECILVDNNSTDNTLIQLNSLLKEIESPKNFQYLILSYNEKPSSYASRNFGARYSNHRNLLFVDIDCIYPLNFFLKLKNRLDTLKETNFAIAGNIILKIRDNDNVFEQYDKAFGFNMKRYVAQKTGVTACAVFNRELFLKHKGFNELESGADRLFFKKVTKDKNVTFCFDKEIVMLHPCRNSKKMILQKTKRVSKGLGKINLSKNSLVKILFLLKNILGIFFPFHQIRVIIRILRKKSKMNRDLKIKLVFYSIYFGSYARFNICKTIIFNK